MPPRVEYQLTQLGRTLIPPLAAIRDWAEAHVHEIIAAREEADARSGSPPDGAA